MSIVLLVHWLSHHELSILCLRIWLLSLSSIVAIKGIFFLTLSKLVFLCWYCAITFFWVCTTSSFTKLFIVVFCLHIFFLLRDFAPQECRTVFSYGNWDFILSSALPFDGITRYQLWGCFYLWNIQTCIHILPIMASTLPLWVLGIITI